MYYNIKDILKTNDLNGFTQALKGEPKRYIIGLTNNIIYSETLLNTQIKTFINQLDNLNIGGRLDLKTNKKYIDISTSSNSLNIAKSLGKLFKQIAIYDLKTNNEIIL